MVAEVTAGERQLCVCRSTHVLRYYNQVVAMLKEKLGDKQDSVEFIPKKDPGESSESICYSP